MAFKISTGLRDHMLATGSLKAGIDGGVIRIYSGSEPSDADAALGAAVLLCTISDNGGGGGISMDTTPASGILSKAPAETWKGTNAATGVASFYRFSSLTDGGLLSTTEKRAQGTVGTLNADLLLADVNLTISQEQRVDFYSIGMPAV